MGKRLCTGVGVVAGILILAAAIATTVILVRRNSTEDPIISDSSPQDQAGGSEPAPVEVGIAGAPDAVGDDNHVIRSEHIAHAVPGRSYTLFDFDGDGQEIVQLDGSRSHSHYFDPQTQMLGSITAWTWYDAQDKQIGVSSTPDIIFPLGTAKIFLEVEDDVGNKHRDTTNVTVLPSTREGTYCYFYEIDGEAFTISENRALGTKPFFGQEYTDINFVSADNFPPQLQDIAFQVRCSFHLKTDSIKAQFTVEHDGPMRMTIARGELHPVVMESPVTNLQNTSTEFELERGLESLEVWYIRLPGSSGRFRLVDTPRPVWHDLKTQLPLIYELSPPNSTLEGGGTMKISGDGLWNDALVYFGTGDQIVVEPDVGQSTDTELFITVPQALSSGEVEVAVGNKFAGSNILMFKYSEDSLCPIRFEQTQLMKDGDTFNASMITNIKYGPDHRLYMASLDHVLFSLSLARDLTVSDVCESEPLAKERAVVGLAFNPANSEPILYVSSNIFFWGKLGSDDPFLWANGKVDMFKPGHNGHCLGLVGPVISGLPVSNHDHGVNGLLFDDDGKLHLMVGGATNAGVPAATVGGINESPYSGANLIADVNKPGFDGVIRYDSSTPEEARVSSGDVEIYQAGWRNSFEQTLHSNGFIYATDNGANSEFGNRSMACTGLGEPISPYDSDDKIGKVIKGKFGGHSNRNRGRDDPVQCVWRSPYDEPTNEYNPPIATVESSTDGIIEFTADIFGGRLKGDLLASKFSTNDENDNGRVYRIQLDENGDKREDVESLFEASGLSIAMTPWGDLLMPRLYENAVMVLKAVYKRDKVAALISVTPFRGPKDGGNEVIITGTGFGRSAVALFDGKPCLDVRKRKPESFRCIVPPGTGGKSVQVSIRLPNGKIKPSSGGYDYRYMRI